MSIVRYLVARLRRVSSVWAARAAYAHRVPRSFLLARAHVCGPAWGYVLAAVGTWALAYAGLPGPVVGLVFAVVLPGLVLDIAAFAAHAAWSAGRVWQDAACPCCDGPADGWGKWVDEGPDGPEDHGLTAADLQFLDLISSGVVSSRPTTEGMP